MLHGLGEWIAHGVLLAAHAAGAPVEDGDGMCVVDENCAGLKVSVDRAAGVHCGDNPAGFGEERQERGTFCQGMGALDELAQCRVTWLGTWGCVLKGFAGFFNSAEDV